MKKFTFWRNAIIAEIYVVEADTEEQARDQLQNGEVEVFNEEWMDWATDDYELEHVEIVDPLYRMVKDYANSPDYFINESGLKIDALTGDKIG